MTRAFTNAGPLLLISSITSSSASFNAFLSWHETCLHWALVFSTACSFASSNGKVGAQQPLPPRSWEQQSCWGSRGRMESSRKHPSAWKKSFTSCSQCNLPSIVKNDYVWFLSVSSSSSSLLMLVWDGMGWARPQFITNRTLGEFSPIQSAVEATTSLFTPEHLNCSITLFLLLLQELEW